MPETRRSSHRLIDKENEEMENFTDILGVLIPLSAVVLGIGVAFWSVYWDYQKKRLQYQERQLMIERGMTPPPALPDERRRVTPEDCLRRGLVQLSVGVGLAVGSIVLSGFADDKELVWIAGVAAAIVGCVGLGNLTYYYIARRRGIDVDREGPVAG